MCGCGVTDWGWKFTLGTVMKKTIIGLLMSAGLASSAFAEKGPNELITYACLQQLQPRNGG
jgi:hypothetical protein